MGSTLKQFHIDEFLLVKSADGVSDGCIRKYKFALNYFRKWIGEDEVTSDKLLHYLGYLHKQPISDWYRKTNAQTLKTFLRYLIKAHYDFPIPEYKLPKLRRKKLCYLTQPEIKQVLKVDLSTRDRLVLRLFISTGLRLSELCELDWYDINFSTGAIDVRHGKGDKFRVVVTDKPTLALLIRYKNKVSPEDPKTPVICKSNGNRLKPMGMRSLINRLRKTSNLTFTAHALRRTFARQSYINGMDIGWLQQLMGHESIETTRDYIQKLDTADLVSTYQKYAPLNM